jgi:AAA family ATP:ADP antiporter
MWKLMPMLIIFFLVSFSYNVLRVMKDTLVVTGESSGPEAIPFIKVWVMFPGTLLMTYAYTWLSNRYDREKVFYIIFSIFLGFFALFITLLYPYREYIHPHQTADYFQSILPVGCKGMIAMCRNWTFSIFYAMSELWGNIILFVLFWGFANQVINLSEGKRFYGVLGIGANLSGIVAGTISYYLAAQKYNPNIPVGTNAWEQTQFMLVGLVLITGLTVLALFYWLNHTSYVQLAPQEEMATSAETGKKLSFRESFTYVFKSRYLMSLASIVVIYNIVINLVEVLWKHEVKMLYSDSSSYAQYMNQVTAIIGLMATLSSLFVSSNAIRKLGWTRTVLITPIILLITSVFFFGSYFAKEYFYGAAMLPVVVFLGTLQNTLSRGAKYSVFDSTKEMAFLPLTTESKIKGKAAIDGVGIRLGKSGGSLMQQALFVMFSGLTGSVPMIAIILFGSIAMWMGSVRNLGQQFDELTNDTVAGVKKPAAGDKLEQQLV